MQSSAHRRFRIFEARPVLSSRFFARLAAAAILTALSVKSARGGVNSWTTNGPPGGANWVVLDPANTQTLYASGQMGFFRSTDGGQSWSPRTSPGPIDSLAIDPHGSTLYAGSGSQVFRSDDGGGHWAARSKGLGNSYYLTALAIDPLDPATLYAGEFEYGCSGPCLFKSTDGGDSWVAIASLASNPDILSIVIDPSNSSTLYVATYGYGAFKSTDGGSSWIALSVDPNPPSVVSLLAVDPVLPTTVYAVSNLGELFKSEDAGASWVTIPVPGDVVSLALDPLTTGGITIGTQFGVFRSADGGETWTSMNSGLEFQIASSLVVDPMNPLRLYAGADGGVFDFERVATPCVPGATVLCLNGGRFQVTASWTNGTDQGGSAHSTPITDDAGYFTFFGTSNVELLVKVLDGCNANGHLWVFAGGLTDRGVVLTVLDTQTGATRIYENAPHTAFGTIQDTGAFVCGAEADARSESLAMRREATAPLAVGGSPRWESGAVGSCIEDGASLCLGAGRYRATAQWFTIDGRSGDGQAMRLTDDTGAFWFFAAANPEVVVKVLDGCGVNSRQWVFAAGLTNVNVVLTVTDTQTGQAKIYVNPQGIPFEAIQDTDAFESCP